jgi:glutamyl-tRNA synthetase
VTLRTRFAPSPTGDLHLGSAFTALASFWLAKHDSRQNGAFVMRIEDLDGPRVVQGSAERILADTRALGLVWDEGPDVGGPHAPYAQSRRSDVYERAIEALRAEGLVYPCDCSRAEIERVASAPHAGEEVVYPGLCRDKDPTRAFRRPPALRLRVPARVVAFEDGIVGPFAQDVARDVGDFVLKRGDGVYAYQLAVVVDDLAMAITDVVRGVDLLGSTPRQLLLASLLGGSPPRYHHVPLVVAADGSRLSKRARGITVRELLEAGITASELVAELAIGLGLADAFSAPISSSSSLSHDALAGVLSRPGPLSPRGRTWPLPARLADYVSRASRA